MTKTNYGEMDVVIDDHTGRAKRVRGGVVALGKGGVSHATASKRELRSQVGNLAPSSYRSKLEAAFAQKLELDRRAGLVSSVHYEPMNLRLPGKKNFYKPDFLVLGETGLIFYEVKGRNKSDDRSLVKMKTAAGLNLWARFVLVKRIRGAWDERVIV